MVAVAVVVAVVVANLSNCRQLLRCTLLVMASVGKNGQGSIAFEVSVRRLASG